jgi:hypothetical protein
MKHILILSAVLFSTDLCAQELHTFSNGEVADADKVNENFSVLREEISATGSCSAEQSGRDVLITCPDGTSGVLTQDPSSKYNYLEQTPTDNGEVLTRFYAFEEYSYDGVIDDQGGFSGRDTNVNALGSFTGFFKITRLDAPHTKESDYLCPNGEAPTPQASRIDWSWRSTSGALHFTSETPNAGRYKCEQYPSGVGFFGVYEGRGLGDLSCITKAVYYGLGYGAETNGYDISWQTDLGYIDMETAVFKPETNGLPGTNYVEITAPEGCIPSK